MFGNGVTIYIVLFTTSGAASCPRGTPVENVQASFNDLHIARVDLIECAEASVRVILCAPSPTGRRLCRALKPRDVRDRCLRAHSETAWAPYCTM